MQHRVLDLGEILAALILRAILIALGATLLSLFLLVMFLVFGGCLPIFTAECSWLRHRDEDPDVEDNP